VKDKLTPQYYGFYGGGHFKSANVFPPTEQAAGKMGSNQYRSNIASTATSPSSNTTQNRRIIDGGLDTKMKTSDNKPQPTTNPTDISRNGLAAPLCDGHGLHPHTTRIRMTREIKMPNLFYHGPTPSRNDHTPSDASNTAIATHRLRLGMDQSP
jgi:hypothetical protein